MEKRQTDTDVARDVLGKIIDFCHIHLDDDKTVKKYLLEGRQLSIDTVRKFKLGAFPSNVYTVLKQFDNWDLQQAGLINHINGKPYSKFCYNRVIIPIYDPYGTPIAIIGRTLLDEEVRKKININKYDNTRFAKSSCLFGLNQAIDSIRKKNEAIIVEGNLDVISAHQAGITNVVGISSAGFTRNQASLISRYTDNVKLMLDNDEAGRNATISALKKAFPRGITISEYKFPEQFKDPDEYFKTLK